MPEGAELKRELVDPLDTQLSIARQCELVGLARSTYYYQAKPMSAFNLELMQRIDQEYIKCPFYGSRRWTAWLNNQGFHVNRKRVQRLLEVMGLDACYPKPNTSLPCSEHRIYPYLLRDVVIDHVDQVWSTDITYVGMPKGFMYLAAIIDWHSRYVISWRVSNTLDGSFCLEMLDEALSKGKPSVFNTDQGCQFTSNAWTQRVEEAGVAVSMDGVGRFLDNIFVERLWRTIKQEELYLKRYETGLELLRVLGIYFNFYNEERLHSSLEYKTPGEVFRQGRSAR